MYLCYSEWENIWYCLFDFLDYFIVVFWIYIILVILIWFKNLKMVENYVVIDNIIFSRIKEVIIIKFYIKNIFGGDIENYFVEDIEKGY